MQIKIETLASFEAASTAVRELFGFGILAGASKTSEPIGPLTTEPLVVRFEAYGPAKFDVESSTDEGATWALVESLAVPGSVAQVRQYTGDGTPYVLRFRVKAIHVSNLVSVRAQVRAEEAPARAPEQRPEWL